MKAEKNQPLEVIGMKLVNLWMNEGRENQPLEVIGKFRRRRFAPKESWVAVHYIYIVYVRPPFAQIIS